MFELCRKDTEGAYFGSELRQNVVQRLTRGKASCGWEEGGNIPNQRDVRCSCMLMFGAVTPRLTLAELPDATCVGD